MMNHKRILFIALVLTTTFAMTSCKGGKRCKGGGWYGDRNLTYTPVKNTDTKIEVYKEEIIDESENATP